MHALVTDNPAEGMKHADLEQDCGQQAVTELQIENLEFGQGLTWEDGVLEENGGAAEASVTFQVEIPE